MTYWILSFALFAQTSDASEDLTGIAKWAVDIMERLGAPGAGLAIALENIFPPLPSEIILPLAGFTVSQGTFSLAEALFWTTLGSVSGAMALYAIGAALGIERTKAIAHRLPLVHVSDIEKTEAWFHRHGAKAVFFGRMLPVFRSLISIPAGIERMPIPQFLLLTTIGSLIWNSIFVVAGYQLGENWDHVEPYANAFQYLVLAAVALVVGVFVIKRFKSDVLDKRMTESQGSGR
ncbi:MAG: DedA family protein [Thermomicrobiales bacterium]|nr:DedA family protein [Thermomicrobiales bacterium]